MGRRLVESITVARALLLGTWRPTAHASGTPTDTPRDASAASAVGEEEADGLAALAATLAAWCTGGGRLDMPPTWALRRPERVWLPQRPDPRTVKGVPREPGGGVTATEAEIAAAVAADKAAEAAHGKLAQGRGGDKPHEMLEPRVPPSSPLYVPVRIACVRARFHGVLARRWPTCRLPRS